MAYLPRAGRSGVLPYLGPLAGWSETLRRPERALIVDVPIEMDDGEVTHFEGFRVQHNFWRGPGRGQPAVRRRQGRHPLRAETALAQGARADTSEIGIIIGPQRNIPGARRERQRPGHGR
jgi:hypothetical protein